MTGVRRAAARVLATAVLACGAVPLAQGAAWACSCAYDQRDPARYAAFGESEQWRSVGAKARTAYVGDVVSETLVDPTPETPWDGSYRYEIRVVHPVKGDRSGTQVVMTSASGAACGRRMALGEVLVVDDTVGLCAPTTQERVAARAAHVETQVQRRGTLHVVAPGESLWTIARTEAVVQSPTHLWREEPAPARVQEVVRRLRIANKALRSSTTIRPGQRLSVPAL